MSRMRIGELAERTGLSQRTIHFYEERGLIAPSEREGRGYRYYDETTLKRLEKIAALKDIGLSLEEIAGVIDLYFADESGILGKRRVLEILNGHLSETESRLSALQGFRKDLKANIRKLEGLIQEAKKS
ncbi:MerR family transcriptional regulator [Pelagibius sp.]|uniref:MerR family transcriptional regulator n=1 Tax=Pelagibius sp. TaxID=1931238 RepID=UPI003B511026